MKRKTKSKSAPSHRIMFAFLFLGATAALLFVVLFFWPGEDRRTAPGAEDHQAQAFLPEPNRPLVSPRAAGRLDSRTPAHSHSIIGKGGMVAVIIDDAGNDPAALERFLRFPEPLTIAVLPQLPFSRLCAEKAHAAGKEVVLHLPLDPLGSENPGPGAVLVTFERERIKRTLDDDFSTVPFAAGVNNHMGSLATQDRAVMDALFSYLKEKNKYFVDSRTVASSLGKEYALRYGVPHADRNYFLDNSPEKSAVLHALNEGVAYARLHGRALLIGHVQHAAVSDVLMEQHRGLVASGIRFVTVSEYLRDEGGGSR